MNQANSRTSHSELIPKAGMYIFLGTEAMMFLTLLAAYVVLRFGMPSWPPAGAPDLPISLTSINTLLLLSSSVTIHLALKKLKKNQLPLFKRYLLFTFGLGCIFILIQAVEWGCLIKHGLNLKTGAYGSCFFTVTGFHGLHVLAGILVLNFLIIQALKNRYHAQKHNQVTVGALYWHFVDLIWIVIFFSLYLI